MTEPGALTAKRSSFQEWQERVAGTNISPTTLLATDYLNHFNEIIMMLGMVPDMPELLDDCREWQPKDYCAHFRDSGFSDRDLAVAAYEHVPDRYRKPFEETIAQMNAVVAAAIDIVDEAIAGGDAAVIGEKARTAVNILQRLQDYASAIIHGSQHAMKQEEIDSLLR
ncbi:MAG: hypothetical protein H3C38_05085 [Rhodospirillales bacterium]|nr:hypothetical protein [Rhodospirillales bacterium]